MGPWESRLAIRPPLLGGISHIVTLGSTEQMPRIETRWGVTVMKNRGTDSFYGAEKLTSKTVYLDHVAA